MSPALSRLWPAAAQRVDYNQAHEEARVIDFKAAWQVLGASLALWWDDWSNQLLVTLAAILLSLTIVFFPAAVFGIFSESLDLTHGLRTGLAGFWQGFKRNLKQSIVWGLLNILFAVGVGFSIWFYANTKFAIAPVLVVFLIIAALVWFLWQYFALACLFLQTEASLRLAWKNSIAVLLTRPVLSLVTGLFAAALTLLSVRYFIPLFIGIPALLAILALQTVQKTLEPK